MFYPETCAKKSHNSFLAIINGYCTWRIIPTLQFMYTNGSALGGNFYCKTEWYIATSSCWAEILFISIESIKYVMFFSMNMLIEIYGCSRRSNIYTTAYSPIQCNEKFVPSHIKRFTKNRKMNINLRIQMFWCIHNLHFTCLMS